jgi:hypothetical protein
MRQILIDLLSCEFESRSWRGVLYITVCDKVCQCLATDRWFSPVSSTNKTDHYDITQILLKVVLKHHKPNLLILIDKILLIDCCLTSSNTLTSDLFNIFTWYFLIF